MRGITNQIRITSNPRSRMRLPWQSLAKNTALIKLGWNISELAKLTHRLQAVLINFERIAQGNFRFKADLIDLPSFREDEYFVVIPEIRTAFAHLNQPKPAGGWLQTALEFGKMDLAKILQENVFQNIMKDPAFKEFMPDDVDKQ